MGDLSPDRPTVSWINAFDHRMEKLLRWIQIPHYFNSSVHLLKVNPRHHLCPQDGFFIRVWKRESVFLTVGLWTYIDINARYYMTTRQFSPRRMSMWVNSFSGGNRKFDLTHKNNWSVGILNRNVYIVRQLKLFSLAVAFFFTFLKYVVYDFRDIGKDKILRC